MVAPTAGKEQRGCFYRALAAWLVLFAAEIVHGAVRALFLSPYVGDFRSRQIGVLTGSILIVIVACLSARWIGAPGTKSRLLVGALWLALTLTFELWLGRIAGRSWEQLLADYDVPRGGLLPFGMAVLALSPLIGSAVSERWNRSRPRP